MNLFITSTSTAGAGGFSTIIMLVVLFAVSYFFMIRPENKRKKEAEAMRNALKVGDNITTIGGIVGDIVSVKDETIVIETSEDRVRIAMQKWAVMTNNSAEEEKKKAQDEAKAKAKERAAAKAKEKAEKKAKKDKK